MNREPDEDDPEELKQNRICAECVGDAYLKSQISEDGTEADCDYCGQPGKTISIEELADYVERAFEEHYYRTSTEPSGFEYAMLKESDEGWERHGEEVDYVIAEAAEVEENIALHVRLILEDRHYDFDNAKMGEECEFAKESHYERKDVRDWEFQEAWHEFEESVKGAERHFNPIAEEILGRIFGDLNEHRTSEGRATVVTAGPDQDIKALYRARVFQSGRGLGQAMEAPDREIGPPPMVEALAGRMNARGVSVFYGAMDANTAIAEVRPPVGSRVIVGRFELVRTVQLLDVSALKDVVVAGSVFDPAFISRLERAKFLERLSDRMCMAVMPNDEPLDYVVTQAISDYLATRKNPILDGILYPSAQQREGAANVVLFHKSSGVLPEVLPPGSEVTSSQGFQTEDGFEEYYMVRIETPRDASDRRDPTESTKDLRRLIRAPLDLSYDYREPTLKLDLLDMYVHHVNAVVYDTSPHQVSRYVTERKTEPTHVDVSGPDPF